MIPTVCCALLPVPPSHDENAPRALLMTLEHEDHTIGLSFVELTLRELGWRRA